MAHHAYFIEGERDEAAAAARAYVESKLGISGASSPDIVAFSFGLFSIDDARRLIHSASISSTSSKKVLIASFTRIFHEAQNALLKVAEEPPEGVTLILCVPSAGIFIPTLRSRLLPLPRQANTATSSTPALESESTLTQEFFAGSSEEREKLVAKLVERSKSDKEDVKQEARKEALDLMSGIMKEAHAQLEREREPHIREQRALLLQEVSSFMPILYERSAPLKLMFEHLLIVIPKDLETARV